MPKFFVEPSAIIDKDIILSDDNYNHIKNVFRQSCGDEILINDRQGNDYKCIIKTIEKDKLIATIKETIPTNTEPLIEVVLFQSLIKGEKMEYVIQKAVELGIAKIVPIYTSRCVVKLEGEKKTTAKIERWNKISEAASKQSGRGKVPKITLPMTFKEGLQFATTDLDINIIPYEKEKNHAIKNVLQTINGTSFGIFIGPEGGFSEEEIQLAISLNVKPITLGNRILRSETASLAVISNLMYQMDEMN